MAWGVGEIIALIGVITAVASAGYSAYSSAQQGEAMGKVNAYNMEIRRREAETKRLVAERNIETQKRKNEADLARTVTFFRTFRCGRKRRFSFRITVTD
jgi:hypothetical protein